jgi:23S rRNA (cytidine1920-2'-O)/16S rRNA (cytidine1409-2'-O)-methyltransferase
MKQRLDEEMAQRGLVQSRSQAQRLIKLGKVKFNKNVCKKPHQPAAEDDKIEIINQEKYVSRSGFKLAAAAQALKLDFRGKTVLDVGSSTGGFTDYALQNGAKKIIAIDVGSNQLHRSLRGDGRVELHEKTDIRDVVVRSSELGSGNKKVMLEDKIDIVLIDVSFISLREVLPSISKLLSPNSEIIAMVKPQFEAGGKMKNKGVIKNDTMRRQILKDFEVWAKKRFVILDKSDSDVAGSKGNLERFYACRPTHPASEGPRTDAKHEISVHSD